MTARLIAQYTGASQTDVQRLLAMQARDVFNDSAYQELISQLDNDYLYETLDQSRAVYESVLPRIKSRLTRDYAFDTEPMSAFTLANWLVGFLQFPDELPGLLEKHQNVPAEAIAASLPELLEALADSPQWQRALATLCLPLMARH